MAIFFTSDTHFGHRNLADYRGAPSVREMDESIIDAWNSRVGPSDDVYHLGDVTFGHWRDFPALRSRLNGRVHLIAGNHDRPYRRRAEFRAQFVEVLDYVELKVDSSLLECGKVVLMHYPLHVWNKSHYGSVHLHGHSHGSCAPVGRRMDIGSTPVPTGRPGRSRRCSISSETPPSTRWTTTTPARRCHSRASPLPLIGERHLENCVSCRRQISRGVTLAYADGSRRFCSPPCAFSWNRLHAGGRQGSITFDGMRRREPVDPTFAK